MIITQVGDTSYRINGTELHENFKEIDRILARRRSEYINSHPEDIQGGRRAIVESIKAQYAYQNSPEHELGYGAVDGTVTPEKFVKVFVVRLSDVHTFEIYSDGYYRVADQPTIESWEESYRIVEREDPYKYLKYQAAKISDDRTVLIARTSP